MNKFMHSGTSWTMQLLKHHYSDNNIFLDLSFQRMACWPLSAKRSYITSIINGAHPGYLILASVNANAYKNEYFKNLEEKGYRYLSIDGNNRSTCISEFMDDKFTVKLNNKPVTYSQLGENEKAQFNALSLGIVMYESIDKKGCADIFLSHNESQALSAQEKRNALIGEISSYFRELEPKVRTKIKTFDSENRRRSNDEFILDTLLTMDSPNTPTGKKYRDEYWKKNLIELNSNKGYLRETLNLLGEFLQIKNTGKQSSDGLAKDFIILRGLMNQNNQTILDTKLFLKKVSEYRTKLFNSRELYEVVDKKGKEESYQYSSLVSLPTYPNPLKKRAELLNNILIKLEEEGIVNTKTKRYVDTSNAILRKQLYDVQKGICPATNKKIDDPLDGQLWEVDHIISIRNGGEDKISNFQLVDKFYNRSKGASNAA